MYLTQTSALVELQQNLQSIHRRRDIRRSAILEGEAERMAQESASSSSCEKFTRRKLKCRSKHGAKAERCWIPELEEKRCLSFLHCPQEAKFYYGEQTDGKKKAACGAWGEAHCFGNPRLMGADSGNQEKDEIFEHHRKFKYKILNNKRKLEICQKLQGDLNKCLQNAVGDR